MSTEKNWSPVQMFINGMIDSHNMSYIAIQSFFKEDDSPDMSIQEYELDVATEIEISTVQYFPSPEQEQAIAEIASAPIVNNLDTYIII